MAAFHDPIRQVKYLRQTLSQDNKPLGFFISAGCPLSIEMPAGKWPLIPDVKVLTQLITDEMKSKTSSKNEFDLLLEEVKKSGRNIENIEDILSFLRGLQQVSKGTKSIRGLTEIQLDQLEKNITKSIVKLMNVELPNKKTPYHQLAKWIHNIERDTPIEVFTTNYDLLLEQAFEDIGVPYFDGFVGSKRPFFDLRAVEDGLVPKHWTRLWKIHGSINWYQKENNEVFRSTEILDKECSLIYPSHLKYDQSRKLPYLALIDRLNSFLRQNSAVLLTCGYSFNDQHLNDTIINALKANPTAMVIGLLFETLNFVDSGGVQLSRYPEALTRSEERSNLSIWTYDEGVIGGQKKIWSITKTEIEEEDNIAEVIKSIDKKIPSPSDPSLEIDVKEYQIQLGNFAIFGNFLEELIGDRQFKLNNGK